MEQGKNEWRCQNEILQRAYKNYLFATKQKEKDVALMRIQRTLEWEPFINFCESYSANVSGISRYGLDFMTEKCIDLIDKVAKGEMNYEF